MSVQRREWSDLEKGEVATFIHSLYELGGYVRWNELADEAGVHTVSLSNWQRGEKMPEGYNLLRLIRATARRTQQAEVAAALAAAPAAAGHPGELEEKVDELVDGLAAVKRALEGLASQQASGAQSRGPEPREGTNPGGSV